jgi:hypothetical protein
MAWSCPEKGSHLTLSRIWNAQHYGEEEITLLEEEVIRAIQHCLADR